MWLDLLSLGQQGNKAFASPEAQPTPEPTSGGVGAFAQQQGAVPKTYMEAYLQQSGVLSKTEKKRPEPVQQRPQYKTTPLDKTLGVRGEDSKAVNTAIDLGLKGAQTVASGVAASNAAATAATLEGAAAAEAAAAIASSPAAASAASSTAAGTAASTTSAASTTASSAGPIGWIIAGLISAYGGISSSIKAKEKAGGSTVNQGKAVYKALNRSDPAAPLRKEEIKLQEDLLDKLF